MTPRGKLNRRSFFATVAGGSALAGGALLFVSGRAEAFQACTDRDSGGNADSAGHGRHCGSSGSRPAAPNTGVTDNDSGDPVNGGRRQRTGCSDNDRGNGSDPGGWGRRCRPATGVTDNDTSDPTNGGRGYRNRNCSDSDSGSNSDNSGQGRHC